MTSPQPSGGRDWDAEFEAITEQLRPAADAAWAEPETRPATRHTFDHGFETRAEESHRDSTELPAPRARIQGEAAPSETTAGLREAPPFEGADDFVPPDPEPIDTGDPATVIMLGCLVLGPLWLLYLLFFDRAAATLWWSTALALTCAGFVMAVARQPKARDEDDDDDGARV